ncbi:hypothetical protein ACP4OV_030455 [Aristida adscensionis]
MKARTILQAISMVLLFSFVVGESGAYVKQVMLSRRGLKEHKLASSEVNASPSLNGFSGLTTSNSNAGATNNKVESTDTADMAGTPAVFTSMTGTTIGTHHELTDDQFKKYEKMINGNNLKKP